MEKWHKGNIHSNSGSIQANDDDFATSSGHYPNTLDYCNILELFRVPDTKYLEATDPQLNDKNSLLPTWERDAIIFQF